ncbi:MAG: hypothetical protein V6Z86_01505 [Hyphomicrobiales bacterium]
MLKDYHFINGCWVGSPETMDNGDPSEVAFAQASPVQIDEACKAARADFSRTIAKEIEVLGDEITRSASGRREGADNGPAAHVCRIDRDR